MLVGLSASELTVCKHDPNLQFVTRDKSQDPTH